jgi:hypothetical protein
MVVNSEFFDLVLEEGAMWVKSQISKSEMHPVGKIASHIATDVIKAVFSEVRRQLGAQWNREYIVALAKACNIERLEIVLLDSNANVPLFLVFGGDYKRFFQVLNSPSISLQDDLAFAQKVSEARKQSSIVIYQRQ